MSTHTNPKQEILAAIKSASQLKTPRPHTRLDASVNVFHKSEESIDVEFAMNFQANDGTFYFANSMRTCLDELVKQLKTKKWENVYSHHSGITNELSALNYQQINGSSDVDKVEVSITCCEYLVAETGSLLFSNKLKSDPKLWFYPRIHIVVAFTSQIVPTLSSAYQNLKQQYDGIPDQVHLITGPSRTYNIEAKKRIGVYGPEELHLFLIDNPGKS